MSLIDQISENGKYLYNEINTIAIGVLLIFLFKILMGKNKIKRHEIFCNYLIGCILAIIFSTIRSNYPVVDSTFCKAIQLLYYCSLEFAVYYFFNFYCTIIHMDAIRKWQVRSIFAIPIAISTINVAKGNMVEATMSFTLSFFVITCTCIGYMVFFTLVENKSYSDRLVCVMTPMLPLVFLFMQPANNMLPLGVGILFSATIGYINSTELLISMDWLTNTNNRYYLYTFIDHKLKHLTNDLHILMIDADDFKKINDTFGHQEGDRCLIRIADAIKIACNKLPRRAYICRYGGDEFIVVAECSDSELFELKANINAELEKLNEVSICKTYISIGSYTQRMNGSSISGLDFVKFADKALYEVKKAKK